MGLYDFSKLVKKGNKIIKKNGGFPVYHKEYKLPANTLRLKFENSSIDPLDGVSSTMPNGIEWKEVGDGIWDLTYNNTDWSDLLNGFFFNEKHREDETKTVYYDIIDSGDTSNVINLTRSFRRCTGLKNICLFDTSNVTNMNTTFCGAWSLKKCPLFNTSKVTTMSGLFSSLTASVNDTMDLEYIPLLDTSNVIYMDRFFSGCKRLKSIPLFDTSKVTTMELMFYKCISLKRIPQFNTSNVENFTSFVSMYWEENAALEEIPNLDYSKGKNFTSTFHSVRKAKFIPENMNLSSAINCGYMFKNCHLIENIPDITMPTNQLEETQDMFYECFNIKTGIKSMYDKLLLAFREDGKQTDFNPGDAGKPVSFTNTFIKCGVDADGNYASETAQLERAQIPTSWGGDLTA